MENRKLNKVITEIQQQTLDIDWFFTDGDKIGFVASGGGKLPDSISNREIEDTDFLAIYFRELPPTNNVIINPNLKKILPGRTDMKAYLAYFIEMAERGLFTYDKTVTNMFSDTQYHLVARPANPIKISELNFDIATIILKTKIDHIDNNLDITSVT